MNCDSANIHDYIQAMIIFRITWLSGFKKHPKSLIIQGLGD